MSWLRQFARDAVPPADLQAWAEQQPGAAAAWQRCPRADWQLWLAAHAPGRTVDDERKVILAATELWPDEGTVGSLFGLLRPVPSLRETLAAWSRPPGKRLDFSQHLVATNQAFLLALAGAYAIDRVWGHAWGTGTSRTLFQVVVVLGVWAMLVVPARLLRRALLQRAVDRLPFAAAFAAASAPIPAVVDRADAKHRDLQAYGVRDHLRTLAARDFR